MKLQANDTTDAKPQAANCRKYDAAQLFVIMVRCHGCNVPATFVGGQVSKQQKQKLQIILDHFKSMATDSEMAVLQEPGTGRLDLVKTSHKINDLIQQRFEAQYKSEGLTVPKSVKKLSESEPTHSYPLLKFTTIGTVASDLGEEMPGAQGHARWRASAATPGCGSEGSGGGSPVCDEFSNTFPATKPGNIDAMGDEEVVKLLRGFGVKRSVHSKPDGRKRKLHELYDAAVANCASAGADRGSSPRAGAGAGANDPPGIVRSVMKPVVSVMNYFTQPAATQPAATQPAATQPPAKRVRRRMQ